MSNCDQTAADLFATLTRDGEIAKPLTHVGGQTECQISDRLSCQKLPGLTLSDPASDQKTIWLFREVLIRRGQVTKLFRRFEKHPNEAGLMGYGGQDD